MTALALLDVSVLIALFDELHIGHGRAHDWFEQHSGQGWASCPLTQNGFVRIVSQPRYPNPTTVGEALRKLAKLTDQPDHMFWANDMSLIETSRFDRDRILGPRQLTDIYLLGLAVKNGGRLVTFDRTISRSAVVGAHEGSLVVL